MTFKFIRLLVAATGILLPLNGGASAKGATEATAKPLPFVSPLFGDNMVLQRGKANAMWGWSEPGDHKQIKIGEQTASAVAGADRRWQVKIQPPPAGGPYIFRSECDVGLVRTGRPQTDKDRRADSICRRRSRPPLAGEDSASSRRRPLHLPI